MTDVHEEPLISVVTPSFNQGKYIGETIDSVLGQGYHRLEYLVIDGGSTDDTVATIRSHEAELAFWTSEPDRGQTHAINKGFARAKGDIVAYLNSDDRYCPGTLSFVANYFAREPECMWLCGNVLFSDAEGRILSRKRPVFSRFALVFGSSSVYQPSVFVRRRVLEEFGQLREDYHTIMDQEWFCRIAARYPPHLVDRDLSIFRWHPLSKSSSGKDTKHYNRYVQERSEVGRTYFPMLSGVLRTYPRASLWILAQLARVDKAIRRVALIALGKASTRP